MQNYREASHPHRDTRPGPAGPFEGPRTTLRQLPGVILAAVLVAIVLSVFALIGARLTPGGGDCVLTDNAGCIDVGSAGFNGGFAFGPDPKREG